MRSPEFLVLFSFTFLPVSSAAQSQSRSPVDTCNSVFVAEAPFELDLPPFFAEGQDR